MELEEFSKKHILILTGNSTHFLRLFSCSSTFRCNIIQKYTVMAEGRSNSVVFPFVKQKYIRHWLRKKRHNVFCNWRAVRYHFCFFKLLTYKFSKKYCLAVTKHNKEFKTTQTNSRSEHVRFCSSQRQFDHFTEVWKTWQTSVWSAWQRLSSKAIYAPFCRSMLPALF